MHKIKRLMEIAGGSLVAAVLLGAPPAGATGEISACITNDGQRIRIVTSTSECRTNETSLQWNV